jgi:hypothetical protein
MQIVSFGNEAHVQTMFGRVGTRYTPEFPRTSPMKQKRKLQQKPTKSRAWLEAECLNLARRTLGGSEIQLVTIRRLHPKGMGPNWKVADIIPQPTPLVSEHVRAALAHLTGAYSLEEE